MTEPIDAATVRTLMDAQAAIHDGAEAVLRAEVHRLTDAWRLQQNLLARQGQQMKDVARALDDLRRYVATQDGSRARTLELIDACRRAAGPHGHVEAG